jgi:hypothetical protein
MHGGYGTMPVAMTRPPLVQRHLCDAVVDAVPKYAYLGVIRPCGQLGEGRRHSSCRRTRKTNVLVG